MIALIALVPAVVVFIVSFWTDSKGWTLFSAVLMAILGAATGNPIFAGLDIVVVFVAYVWSNYLLKDRLKRKNAERQRQARVAAMESERWDMTQAKFDARKAKALAEYLAMAATMAAEAKAPAQTASAFKVHRGEVDTPPFATYYDTLQIARSADAGVVRAAYKALCQQYHPDKNLDDATRANTYMQRINEAYEVLSDKARRDAYDITLAGQEASAAAS